jgi:hypothetical protein
VLLVQHNPEEVKAKMEKLGEVQLEKAKFIEKSRERLRELSVPVRNASVSLPLSPSLSRARASRPPRGTRPQLQDPVLMCAALRRCFSCGSSYRSYGSICARRRARGGMSLMTKTLACTTRLFS